MWVPLGHVAELVHCWLAFWLLAAAGLCCRSAAPVDASILHTPRRLAGFVQRRWVWVALFAPLWGSLVRYYNS